MISDIIRFIQIVKIDLIKLYKYILVLLVGLYLELTLFNKIGEITSNGTPPSIFNEALLGFIKLPYSTVTLTILSIIALIFSKYYIIKLTGQLAFEFWKQAYKKFFNHILYLNDDKSRSNGEYVTFLSSKLEIICQTISIPLLNALHSFIYLTCIVVILIWNIKFEASVALLAFGGIGLTVIVLTRKIFGKISQIVEVEYSALNKSMQSSISSRMELFVHNSSAKIISKLIPHLTILTEQKSKTYTYSNIVKILLESSIYIILAAIIIFEISSEILNLGYLLLIFRSFPHVQSLFHLWAHLKSITGLVGDGLNIIQSVSTLNLNPKLLEFEGNCKSIMMNLKSHRFVNTSITINKGEVTIINGESGIGKSSILKELIGIAPPSIIQPQLKQKSGINDSLKISYCGQRPFFLELSIRTMFELSCEQQIDDEQIWKCLDLFDLSDRIASLDEVLKLDGSNLSGGEMSRLSMAVGVSRNPDIMILDETLANLNPEMRKKTYMILRKAVETVIMITHDTYFLNGDEKFIAIQSQL